MDWSYLFFFCIIAYGYLGCYVFIKGPWEPINLTCAALLTCFLLWSIESFCYSLPTTSKADALFWSNVGAVGWIGLVPFSLLFALHVTEKTAVLRRRYILIAFFLPAPIFIVAQFYQKLILDFTKQSYGWVIVWKLSVWIYLCWIYLLLSGVIAVILLYFYSRTAPNEVKRKQSRIIFNAALVTYPLGVLTDIVFPVAGLYATPALGNVVTLIFATGLSYAIVKYKLMTISPATAADNIISTMNNLLFLLSPEGKIVMVNNATANRLGYRKEAMKNVDISDLLIPDGQGQDAIAQVLSSRGVNNVKLDIKTSAGDTTPIILSTSHLCDQGGRLIGIVAIASDISELAAAEKERERIIKELETALDKIRTLRGLLPICAHCKKIRDDQGYWTQIESYVSSHSEAEFSHGICPECVRKHYPGFIRNRG